MARSIGRSDPAAGPPVVSVTQNEALAAYPLTIANNEQQLTDALFSSSQAKIVR